MSGQDNKQTAPAPKWLPGPVIKTGALLVTLVLLALVGIRLLAWSKQAEETRAVVLVNPWNEMDNSDYTPHLRETEEGFRVDSCCRKALEQMLAECRQAGFDPRITAAYRSREEQQALYDSAVQRLQAEGKLDLNSARAAAARIVATPGCSEHELGLAVHLSAADGRQEETLQWFRENGWRYGFILRYPQGGEEVTGMEADPTHFRYVGLAAAGQIFSLNITLEEYMGMFFSESAQIIFE